jgi:hypothetical protein
MNGFENTPSVFLTFLTHKRLIIGLIIKRLWVFDPSVFGIKKAASGGKSLFL